MKNTFWKRERIEIMIALALFNYVFLGAEYLFDNMMAFQTDSGGVVLAQSYVLGSEARLVFFCLAYWMVNCGKEQRRQAVLVPEFSRLYVCG
ncbi:MAG: hypothetical protein ACLVCH_04450 [Roseburia inulinivorans]